MAIFVDIFMAACLLLALVLGVRQGFLQSLARVAIIIVALLGAAWLAEHLADPAAKWLEPMLTEKIQQQMDGQAAAADDPSLAAAEARGSAAADCRGAGKTQKKAEKIQIPVFFSA